MSVHGGDHGALEYYPCRYGRSRVLFRGPRKQMTGDYVAFLGSTETYGRFIEHPYATLLEQRLGVECVNLGAVNAGVDLYLNDTVILDLAIQAKVKVVQIMGAQNMSNRYYSVHPRRNDRFLRASDRLEVLYPEVDFTEFHFVRHMLGRLREVSEERFNTVVDELRQAWIARMKSILSHLRGDVVLLWFADHAVPPDERQSSETTPLYVTRSMIQTLKPRVTDVVEVVASDSAMLEGTTGMVFSDFDACAASEEMGPAAHREVADALEEILGSFVGEPAPD